jgi:hypothetical protein
MAVIVGAAAVLWLGTASARSSQATLTSTSITCPSVIVTGQIGTCKAVVSDTDTVTATTPSGTVDFSASSTVQFSEIPRCTLSPAGSCQITYTGSPGTATITASYDGDSSHATSSATQQIAVTAPIGRFPARLCFVPRVTGKTVAQARRALRHSQCGSGRISHAFSKRIKKGRVISQKPGPHQSLPYQYRVRLVVSKGKRP